MQKEEVPEYLNFILQYVPFFKSHAFKMTMNHADAEDLIQSSLIRAIKYPPQNNDYLKAWMLRIMFSEHTTKRKRKYFTEKPLGDLEAAVFDEDVSKNEISDEVKSALDNCEYGQLFYDWAVNETPIRELEKKYNLARSGVFHKIKETKERLQQYLKAA